MKKIKKISFIGSGNVATHLSKALFSKKYIINQIYSPNIQHAEKLAKVTQSKAIDSLLKLTDDADLYIISITDDAIEKVLKQISLKNKLFVHTSGSVEMNIFKKYKFAQFGIFYPLQTFSKSKRVYLQSVPFCIEANTRENAAQLIELASQLSKKVYQVNSVQRKYLHLAAVFACNFSNNMYQIAYEICKTNQLDFDILKPLITETANKIMIQTPKEAQTGPAKRRDAKIIEKHLALLDNQKKYKEIYQLITENILSE